MQHAVRLAPQTWMQSATTQRLLVALTAGGAEVRFVGGCVRDAIAGRPVSDIDVATPDPPDRVVDLLTSAGLHAVPTGVAHGTVTAVVDGHPYEVTTLRHDVETFGRHARVAFTDDWQADAARRDFTMNALSCRPDGAVFDPFDGIADLRAGRIRFVGDARRRIAEDVLRLLRFFRFYAWYGTPPPDAEGLAACREAAPMLAGLSAERVRREFLRLLEAPDPMPALRAMDQAGILMHLLPEPHRLARLAALVDLERARDETDPVRRLAALVQMAPDAVDALALRLRLSNGERRRLVDAARFWAATGVERALGDDVAAMRRRLYRDGADRYRDLAYLGAAEGGEAVRLLSARLEEARAWTVPRLPINGRDAAEVGVTAGPAVGAALRAVEAWWMERDFRPDREACLAELRSLAVRGSAAAGG